MGILTLLLTPLLVTISMGLVIASLATNAFSINNTDYTLLYVCVNSFCLPWTDSCSERGKVRAADLALLIIAVIVLFIAWMCSLVRLCATSCHAPGNCAGRTIVVTAIMSALMVLCGWAMGFAIFDAEFCGVAIKNLSGAKLGPHAPLGVVAFVFCVGTAVAEFLLNAPFGDAPAPAPATVPNGSAPAPFNIAPGSSQ
jgi:hypothetical protein